MIRTLVEDAVELARAAAPGASVTAKSVMNALVQDGFIVLALTRVRELARSFHVPGVNRTLRLAQQVFYGIEIGKDVQLGRGVWFVHSLGTVVGGTARVGDRVRFMGNNTVGTAKDNGCPIIEDDVVVGGGARILGPIRIGAGATIGANAVVLTDVPAGAIATGVPAVVRRRGERTASTE
jgi:serine O-acetyltransferase